MTTTEAAAARVSRVVPRPAGPRRTWRDFGREFAIVGGLILGYKVGRQLVADRIADAFTNAAHLVRLESWLRLPSEATVQGWVLHSPGLLRAANEFYVGVHFPLTIAFLLWAWFFRPHREYVWARSLIVAMTVLALAVHLTIPLAPPRLLPQLGFVDTMALIGPSAYGAHAERIANEYAALPSLHVGWALLVAVVVIVLLRSRWRWLALIHPALTFAVVTVTANHWWLDSLLAVVLLGVALVVYPPGVRSGAPSLPARLLRRRRAFSAQVEPV